MTDNKYKNGKIYTIRYKNDDNLIYIGSTIQPLYKRFADHKLNANYEKHESYNMLLYKQLRETNIDDWYIELYEDKEYYEANKDKIKECYETNKKQKKRKKIL